MINTILTMGLTGSAVVLAWLAVDKLARERLSAAWHDRILRLALFFMLVPLGQLWEAAKELFRGFLSGNTVEVPTVMQTAPTVTPSAVIADVPLVAPETAITPAVTETAQRAAVSVSLDVFQLLTVVWAVGAAAILIYKLWCYIRFRRLLGKERRPLSEQETEILHACQRELNAGRTVEVFINPAVPTPMATGLVWPVIFLPDRELSDEELRYVLLHELTHLKRCDLWVRFFALCGVVVHWYNPFMHLLNQKIKERSEQSCDEQVARPMSKEERLAYGSMLLKMATDPAVGPTEWAVTLSTKESIQKRLGRIVKAGHWTRMDKAVAVVSAVLLLICGTVAACCMREPLAVEDQPEQSQQEDVVPAPDAELGPVQTEQQVLPEEEEQQYAPAGEAEPIVEAVEVTGPTEQTPDSEEPAVDASTVTIGGETYETYVDNLGVTRLKDSVGNADSLDIEELLALNTLVDGKYPVNDRGEAYGLAELADYVGESPELIAISGLDKATNNLSGYVWWQDYYADFSDPTVAAKYEAFSLDSTWLNISVNANMTGWYIPLYNAEHIQIGVYAIDQQTVTDQSREISALEDKAAQEAEALLKDEAASSKLAVIEVDGVVTYRPANNHGYYMSYSTPGGLPPDLQAILDELPNGTYPKNSKGEYYGNDEISYYLNIEPDLILATGTDGQEGYVWWEDANMKFDSLDDLDKVIWNEKGYLIPLYDSEHSQIGWKQEVSPYYFVNGNSIRLNEETVGDIRAQLS